MLQTMKPVVPSYSLALLVAAKESPMVNSTLASIYSGLTDTDQNECVTSATPEDLDFLDFHISDIPERCICRDWGGGVCKGVISLIPNTSFFYYFVRYFLLVHTS